MFNSELFQWKSTMLLTKCDSFIFKSSFSWFNLMTSVFIPFEDNHCKLYPEHFQKLSPESCWLMYWPYRSSMLIRQGNPLNSMVQKLVQITIQQCQILLWHSLALLVSCEQKQHPSGGHLIHAHIIQNRTRWTMWQFYGCHF